MNLSITIVVTVVVLLMVGLIVPVGASDCDPIASDLHCSKSIKPISKSGIGLPQRPAYLESLVVPGSDTRLKNISEGLKKGENGKIPMHSYSRRQAWNSDESVLDLGEVFVDAKSYKELFGPIDLTTERNWSNLNPDWLYGIQANPSPNLFGKFDIATGIFEPLLSLSQYERCSIGAGEGSLSNDDSRVVFSCKKPNGVTNLLAYDVPSLTLLGTMTAKSSFNWASYSQSGKYIVVENNGLEDNGEKLEELWRYDEDFGNPVLLTKDRNHGDLGIDDNGNDVFVMLDWYRVSYIVLDTKKRVRLSIANKSNYIGHGHVSCRNIKRPGWCYLSGDESRVVGAFRLNVDNSFFGRVKSLFIDKADSGIGAFESWGYHYSSSASYDAQPKVSTSPSGEKIIFSSDWEGQSAAFSVVVEPEK